MQEIGRKFWLVVLWERISYVYVPLLMRCEAGCWRSVWEAHKSEDRNGDSRTEHVGNPSYLSGCTRHYCLWITVLDDSWDMRAEVTIRQVGVLFYTRFASPPEGRTTWYIPHRDFVNSFRPYAASRYSWQTNFFPSDIIPTYVYSKPLWLLLF